ncbi:porin family protein [Vibrio fluvialis]|uniref:porin family protein n=1 Tax=Vibrio fluvialis TaxID=676 RepID=UPI0028F72CA0|nr:porin family protein [Vibrio fluvialis]
MRNRYFVLVALSLVAPVKAAVYLTPFVGYTVGGEVEDSQGNAYDVKPSASFALAAEIPYQTGRFGLFYATQQTDIDNINQSAAMHYLQFQSSLYYPIDEAFSSYLGLGVGASYADVDWAENKYGFSASIFTGLEYRFTSNIALNTQLRWLGTVVDNDTSAVCSSGDSTSKCLVHFKSDWMNQFSANLGMTIHF